MKPSSQSSRTPSGLSDPLHHRLNLYALAAGSAGVSLLALTQSAEAKIVYTKAHIVIGTNHIYELDLNHDGTADFKISNHTFFTDTTIASLGVFPVQSKNGVVGKPEGIGLPPYAYALLPGATVGPKQPFRGASMAWSDGADRGGRWANVRGRYLGLKFSIEGKIHYGWARLNVTTGGNRITATLTGYAYETIPNKPIISGKTEGPEEGSVDEANPESLNEPTLQPASLGLLTMGSPGLSVWRREESVGAIP
jgi:hypothetical protein